MWRGCCCCVSVWGGFSECQGVVSQLHAELSMWGTRRTANFPNRANMFDFFPRFSLQFLSSLLYIMASSSLGIVNPKKRREIDGVGGSSMVHHAPRALSLRASRPSFPAHCVCWSWAVDKAEAGVLCRSTSRRPSSRPRRTPSEPNQQESPLPDPRSACPPLHLPVTACFGCTAVQSFWRHS